jgi:hypothetical protein
MIPLLQGFFSRAVQPPTRWVRFGQHVDRVRVGLRGYALVDRAERLNYDRSLARQATGTYEPPLLRRQYEKLLKKAR